MKRARTILTAAAALAAAFGAGCSTNSSFSSNDTELYYYAGGVGDGVFRHNVGYGDSLGAALWGHDITLAKAHQFGDTEFASVDFGYGFED